MAVGRPDGACGRADQGQLSGPEGPGRGRRGPEKAALAVAHSILVIAWQFLTSDQPYLGLENTCRGLRLVAEIPTTQWAIVGSTLGCLIAG